MIIESSKCKSYQNFLKEIFQNMTELHDLDLILYQIFRKILPRSRKFKPNISSNTKLVVMYVVFKPDCGLPLDFPSFLHTNF